MRGNRPPLASLLGSDLSRVIEGGYFTRLFPDLVAKNPTVAVERLSERCGHYPTSGGENIDGIVALRDALFRISGDSKFANALVITVPHTHWSFEHPITLGAHAEDYMISARAPRADERYVPVSFVFSPEGPLAYEWADATIQLDDDDLGPVFDLIGRLNAELHAQDWPLGLSLNFRFKPLFSDQMVPTVEFPVGDDPDGPALIVPLHRYLAAGNDPDVAQVAWHAYSDLSYGLGSDGVQLLRAMRRQLPMRPQAVAR